MATMYLENQQMAEDFVRGCTFMGTGGGGLPANGLQSLMSEINKGTKVGWVDMSEIPDDAMTACPFLMGSIAPHTPEVEAEMAENQQCKSITFELQNQLIEITAIYRDGSKGRANYGLENDYRRQVRGRF